MYIAGTDRCQIYVEEPAALVVALYLREVAGLNPPLEYVLPKLDPPITAWPVWARRAPADWVPPLAARTAEVDRHEAGIEWVRWWEHLLTVDASSDEDFHPPSFREYRSVPLIRLLLQRHYEEATRWVEALTGDPRVKRDQATPRPGLFAMVNELESDPVRIPLPFRLRLSIIPVGVKHAWPMGPEHILLSRRLMADTDNVLDWLRPRIFALAHRGSVLHPTQGV